MLKNSSSLKNQMIGGSMKITVVGVGYVGLSIGLLLSKEMMLLYLILIVRKLS